MLSIINPNHFGSSKTSNSQNPKIAEISPKIALARAKMNKPENFKNSTQKSSVSTVKSKNGSENEKINIPVPKPRSRSISRNASANSRSVF